MVNPSPSLMQARKALPADGMSRWAQIAPFSPFGREKFRQLVVAGKAPQPVRFSLRCTAYSNAELLKFFADPLNYHAGAVQPACKSDATVLAKAHANPVQPGFAAYEAAKQAWRAEHPDATPDAYTAAMRTLADLHGV